jgi:hypothetical protein
MHGFAGTSGVIRRIDTAIAQFRAFLKSRWG